MLDPAKNPLAGLLILLVRAYQLAVSPWLPPSCKYMPTCSAYMIEAIQRRGVVMGVLKGIYRLLRCNPFSKGGYDPVE